jgi:hypothetical protein
MANVPVGRKVDQHGSLAIKHILSWLLAVTGENGGSEKFNKGGGHDEL